jgi:2-oxoacid:acceptor oxidoreductase delta subunit (pyruvate/2-ketoisovalerate family)
VETNAAWRSQRPVLSVERCTGCLRCYLACPDGAVLRAGAVVRIDYDFCKGCGICAHECNAQVILMIPEENKDVR